MKDLIISSGLMLLVFFVVSLVAAYCIKKVFLQRIIKNKFALMVVTLIIIIIIFALEIFFVLPKYLIIY